ncbi:MAG: VOC family protein [Planctomycetota bacterium]
MIKGLAHLCFNVENLQRSEEFYVGKLGLNRAFDFTRESGEKFGCYIRAGGRQFIELFERPLGEKSDGQSYQHLCLEVDDLESTVEQLRGRGVDVSDPKLGRDHSWQAWITDPDGNRIELHQYTPESWHAPHLA